MAEEELNEGSTARKKRCKQLWEVYMWKRGRARRSQYHTDIKPPVLDTSVLLSGQCTTEFASVLMSTEAHEQAIRVMKLGRKEESSSLPAQAELHPLYRTVSHLAQASTLSYTRPGWNWFLFNHPTPPHLIQAARPYARHTSPMGGVPSERRPSEQALHILL